MLRAALAAVHDEPGYVFVVVANHEEGGRVARELVALAGEGATMAGCGKVYVGTREIAVVTAHEIGLRWATGTHRGFVGIQAFADHFAIEQACGWALDQHARWGGREQRDGRAELVAAIGELLAAHGCDCECGHDTEGHDAACERCLGCQIGELLR